MRSLIRFFGSYAKTPIMIEPLVAQVTQLGRINHEPGAA